MTHALWQVWIADSEDPEAFLDGLGFFFAASASRALTSPASTGVRGAPSRANARPASNARARSVNPQGGVGYALTGRARRSWALTGAV